MRVPALATRILLHCIRAWDRRCLRRLARRHPGLEIDPRASTNFSRARFELGPGARLRIGAGVVTERRAEGVRLVVEAGAEIVIGAGTWLRSDLQSVHLVAFEGGRIEIGRESFLNGCHLSAKREVRLGERVMVGPGSRVFDSDQHALDADRPEQGAPVAVGDCVWIASDVTVLRGVEIGAHSVVGAHALVTRSLPPHSLAYGAPAEVRGRIGDRTPVAGSLPGPY
jgi:acetyltransferase-like isoleucine patch superfamily enzyme